MGKVAGLWLEVNGRRRPLSSAAVRLAMPLPSCQLVPLVGTDGINGTGLPFSGLEDITTGMPAKVLMRWDDQDMVIFSGRVTHQGFDNFAGAWSTLGSFVPVVTLGHSVLDLSSVVMNTVMLSDGTTDYTPFRGEGNGVPWAHGDAYVTKALAARGLAVHVRDICALLSDWYQDTGQGGDKLDIRRLVRAAACEYRFRVQEEDRGLVQAAVASGTEDAAARAFTGRQSILSVMSALAELCLLTLVPRMEDSVLVPETAGFKLPAGAPVISRRHVTKVGHNSQRLSLPVSRVVVNMVSTYLWYTTGKRERGGQVSPGAGGGAYVGSFYPPLGNGEAFTGAVQVSPPPLLADMLIQSIRINGDNGGQPTVTPVGSGRMDQEGAAQSGETPFNQSPEDARLVGDATARMMYGALAYAGGKASVSMAFEGLVEYSKLRHPWSDGTIYSLLGRVVGVEAPYPGREANKGRPFTGLVSSISLDVSVEGARLLCGLELSNVRPRSEDERHSLPLADHPLYSNIESAELV